VGLRTILWGSDNPHIEGSTFGHTQKTLRKLFDHADGATTERITRGAFLELFPSVTSRRPERPGRSQADETIDRAVAKVDANPYRADRAQVDRSKVAKSSVGTTSRSSPGRSKPAPTKTPPHTGDLGRGRASSKSFPDMP